MHSKNKWYTKISLGIVLLSLIVVAGAGCNPFKTKPDKVIGAAQMNLLLLNSTSISGDFTITGTGINTISTNENVNIETDLTGSYNGNVLLSDEKKLQAAIAVNFNAIDQNGSATGKIEFRQIDEQGYIQLKKLNFATELITFSLDNLSGNWYTLPEDDDETQKKNNERSNNIFLTFKQLRAGQSLKKRPFVNVTTDHGIENYEDPIEGSIEVHHYEGKLHEENIKKFITEVQKAEKNEMNEEEREKMEKNLEQAAQATIELWIDTDTKNIRKIQIRNLKIFDEEKGTTANIDMNIQLSNFNAIDEPISPPDNSKPFEEFMKDLLEAALASSGL